MQSEKRREWKRQWKKTHRHIVNQEHSEWKKRDRKRRPEHYRLWHRNYRAYKKAWYDELLRDMSCASCDFSDFRVLEWAHRPEFPKVGAVVEILFTSGWKRTLIEMEKCVVLCANCHKIYDYERRFQK